MALNLHLTCDELDIPKENFFWPPSLTVVACRLSESTRERLKSIPGLEFRSSTSSRGVSRTTISSQHPQYYHNPNFQD